MVRIKILEDDPADRDTLIECLRKYEREQGQSFSITAYDNPSDFMDNYHMDADLIFMDIELPGINGIELAGEINRIAPECKIVFISSYIFYAPEVYDTEHIYFVLKSQIDERLPLALSKAVASIAKPKCFMPVKSGASVTRLPAESVMYLERVLHKTRVVTGAGSFMTTQSPAELLSGIGDDNAFIHCHQSYWVNVRNVATMETNGFKLASGALVPISRAQKVNAREAFFRMLAEKK